MGVQLSEATKAARELGPEARAQLSNVVKREDLLILLQEKADNSTTKSLSEQAASSIESIEQLSEQVANLLRLHTQSLITLSSEREQGDAALGSRLDKIQATIMSLKVPSRPQTKGTSIKLPSSMISSTLTARIGPDEADAKDIAAEPIQNLPSVLDSRPETDIDAPTSQDNATSEAAETSALKYPSSQSLPRSSPPHPEITHDDAHEKGEDFLAQAPSLDPPGTKGSPRGLVDAKKIAKVERSPALVSYLQPGMSQAANHSPRIREGHPISESCQVTVKSDIQVKSDDLPSLRCLSCDAPTSRLQFNPTPLPGRIMGAGFRIDNSTLAGLR